MAMTDFSRPLSTAGGIVHEGDGALPLRFVAPRELPGLSENVGPYVREWLERSGFAALPGQCLLLPDAGCAPALMLVGMGEGDADDPAAYVRSVRKLPGGHYRLADLHRADEAIAIGWALGSYGRVDTDRPMLVRPQGLRQGSLALADMECWVRDLINQPANVLGPDELADAVRTLAERYGASTEVIRGDALLEHALAGIHAVGKGSNRAPVLIDLRWGDPAAPRLTLIGKGVCFDAGGLDIKRQPEIATMKSDMAGAAHAIALAGLAMQAGLKVNLRLLVPAADNLPSAGSVMPGDVVRLRNGKTVEIANCDYEGRILLADALSLAVEENPALLVDFASLTTTGLGPAIAALFTRSDALAEAMAKAASETCDRVWRLPLHGGYASLLASEVADVINFPPPESGVPSMAAGLFLAEFVPPPCEWLHLDIESWNTLRDGPLPLGGNVSGLRASWRMLQTRFGG